MQLYNLKYILQRLIFTERYALQLSSSGYMNVTEGFHIYEIFPGIPMNLDAVFTWPATIATNPTTFFFKVTNVYNIKSILKSCIC